MKKSQYSNEQIVRILREADKDSVSEVAKRHGVSEQSIYSWHKLINPFTSQARMLAVNMVQRMPVNGEPQAQRARGFENGLGRDFTEIEGWPSSPTAATVNSNRGRGMVTFPF